MYHGQGGRASPGDCRNKGEKDNFSTTETKKIRLLCVNEMALNIVNFLGLLTSTPEAGSGDEGSHGGEEEEER